MKIIEYSKVWFGSSVRPAEFMVATSGLAALEGKVRIRRVIDDYEDTCLIEGYGTVPQWEVPWTNVVAAVRASKFESETVSPPKPAKERAVALSIQEKARRKAEEIQNGGQ